jgi:uncharacterized protein YdeI (YjbR/CyaY-like superfamily)
MNSSTRSAAPTDGAITAFHSPAQFRRWLGAHHADTPELLIRCYKTQAAGKGMTYLQAVEEALCFGWIDGVRRSVDEDSFSVRFTPRKPRSIWSRVNLARIEALTAAGRMAAPGLAAVRAREPSRTGLYSFERAPVSLAPALVKRLRARREAWTHFQAQPPSYRRTVTFWIMNAKRAETQMRRLEILITCSAAARRIPLLARDRPK